MRARRLTRVAVVVAAAAVAIGIVAIVKSTRGGSSGSGTVTRTISSATASRPPRTFYVSSAGDDNADGTAAHPWRTVAKVNATPMVPGDRVLLAGGQTFTDQLRPQGSGRRNATVTATSDAEIYAGSASEFRRIMEVAPSVAEKIHQTIASRTLPVAA